MKHRHGNESGNVKPNGHVHVPLPPFEYGTHHVDAKHHPNERDGNVNGPFQLGILLRGSHAQGQGNGCGHNDELPAPEVNPTEHITKHARFEQPLHGVIDPGKHRIAHKGKNDGIGVKGS